MVEKRRCQDDIPPLGATARDFWAWAYSDVLSNTGLLREPAAFRGEVLKAHLSESG
jgi:hypothetical protein